MAWWMSSSRSEKGRFLFFVLPSLICWHIWKARNKAYYEGVQMRLGRICHDILIDMKGVVEVQFNQRLGVQTFLQLYEGTAHPPPCYSVQLVGWRVTEEGTLTLNTDGCSKGNPGVSGGGGILRDSLGLPLFVFSTYFGETSSLRAEVLALATRLRLCM
ncbi:uncharacterized protein LOC113774142 [Coffea eugenioides]|uniref:uncharacterized protein LOC113774142 n=1 Tax=Coffea eugenioides TaxID=49369 RepID=UPI000F60A6C4|nr:uncharacterized protein LOC113774142 [Coffea eugenioides]